MTDIAVIALSLGLEKNHIMQDYQSNRPVRQQPPGRFPNESDRTVERIRKIKKKQAQFLETRKFQINEIARIFRVPPHMVGDLEKSSFSNIEQ